MSNPTWNGATVPTAGDAYNHIPDLTKAFNTAGLTISVASQAARDALAATAPGSVLPVPTVVYRSDINVLEVWNGATWSRNILSAFIDWTNASGFGNGFTTGTAGGYNQVQYTLRNGIVTIAGASYNASAWSAGNAVFLMPSNILPTRKILGESCAADPGGNLIATTSGLANSYLTLSISYPLA